MYNDYNENMKLVEFEEYSTNVRILGPNMEYPDYYKSEDEYSNDDDDDYDSDYAQRKCRKNDVMPREDDEEFDEEDERERKPKRTPVDKVIIKNRMHKADNDDDYLFDGTYIVNVFDNKVNVPYEYEQLYFAKNNFTVGNVIYRQGCEEIVKRCMYYIGYGSPNPPKDNQSTQMRTGTICPTKEVIHDDGELIVTSYGRYIYGFNKSYVRFVDKQFPYDHFDLIEVDPKRYDCEGVAQGDHNYAVVAEDGKTKVLLCFALYR